MLYPTQSRCLHVPHSSRHRLTNPSVYGLSEIPWAPRTELKWTSLGALEDGKQFKLNSRATLGETAPEDEEAARLESSVPSKVTVATTSSFGENKTFLAMPAHPVGRLISSVFLSLGKGSLRPGSGPSSATFTLGCPLSHTTSPDLGYLLLENEGGICMVISKVPLNAKLL